MRRLILICIKEFKSNWLLYLFGFALLSSIFSVALFIQIASANIIEGFYEHTNSLSELGKGFSVKLAGLHYSSINDVKDLPFSEVYPSTEGGVHAGDYFYNNNDLSEYSIDAVYFKESSDYNIIEGRSPSTEDNNSYYAWVSLKASQKLNCRLGEKIVGDGEEYEIVGIIEKTKPSYDIIIPFGKYYSSKTEKGEYVAHTIYGILSDSHNVMETYSKLKQMGISPSNSMDDIFNFLELLSILFRVLFIITFAAGLWAFSNVCNVVLNNRFNFIIRMRVLGMSTRFISSVYVLLMGTIMICSFLTVSVWGSLFEKYIKNVMDEIFLNVGTLDNSRNMLCFFIISISLCIFLIVKTFLEINRRVEKSDLISVLEEKV